MSKTSPDVGEGKNKRTISLCHASAQRICVLKKKKKKKIPVEDKLTFQNYKMYKEIIHFMQKSMERRLDFQNVSIHKVTKVVASRMLKMPFKWKHYREKQDVLRK